MKSFFRHYTSSLIVTVVGLLIAYAIGHFVGGTVAAGLSAVFICLVLSVLEVSLSFDNAVVNAKVLNEMTPIWRHRFLTWGILIAVFGMRIVFPLAIVGVTAHLNPWEALVMAAVRPDEYAAAMKAAHIPVAAFGGAFLLMVALRYFLDANKETHWLQPIERFLMHLGKLESSALALAMIVLVGIAYGLPMEEAITFLVAGIAGLVVFIVVDGASSLLEEHGVHTEGIDLNKASAAMFIYLEVLDASFSFDGVVGAFAITNNLFIIAIGLGIGAMFVRSMTVMLVEHGTLTEYRYLEHGAFWAIGILAALMFAGTYQHIPEVVTGLAGAAFIGLSFWSSVRYNRRCGPNAPGIHGSTAAEPLAQTSRTTETP
jgi:uncharacterized protein